MLLGGRAGTIARQPVLAHDNHYPKYMAMQRNDASTIIHGHSHLLEPAPVKTLTI